MGEKARDGEVIDVVSSHWCVGAISAKASKASDDETRVRVEQMLWIETDRLEHSWAERVDEDIGMVDEGSEKRKAVGGFEV